MPVAGSSTRVVEARRAGRRRPGSRSARQLVAVGEQHRALDGVPQLADVAGPAVRLQPLHRLGGDAAHPLLELGVVGVDVEVHERRNVVGALAQRRQHDRQHVQAVVQILAEASLPALRPRGCGSSRRSRARRRGCRRTPPTRLKVFSSRNRSSFACSAGTISPISSRNTVPPSADSSRPRFCWSRVGERAALVAEQLALEQRLGQRRAGDVHERARRRGRSS